VANLGFVPRAVVVDYIQLLAAGERRELLEK